MLRLEDDDLSSRSFPSSLNTASQYCSRFSAFDVSDSIDSSDGNALLASCLSLHRYIPDNVMMLCFLEQLCYLHCDGNSLQSHNLLEVICERLHHLGLLPNIQCVERFKVVREKFSVLFLQLLNSCKHVYSKELISKASDVFPDKYANSLWATAQVQSWYLDMFQDEELIGSGGFGSVFRAKNKLDGGVYAVKKVLLNGRNLESCLKVLREVRILSSLSHRNVIRYFSSWMEYPGVNSLIESDTEKKIFFNDQVSRLSFRNIYNESEDVQVCVERDMNRSNSDRRSVNSSFKASRNYQEAKTLNSSSEPRAHLLDMVLYISMELCNETLHEWLLHRNEFEGTVNVKINRSIVKQLLLALEYVHSRGLIHRDLKPRNIFVLYGRQHDACEIKIGDFGLARYEHTTSNFNIDESGNSDAVSQDRVSCTEGVGTPTYAAPEQIVGGKATVKADMYSLGIILYELYEIFQTEMEKIFQIERARKGLGFISAFPKEANLQKLLMHQTPADRPSASEVLMDLFREDDQIIANLAQENDALRRELDKREAELTLLRRLLKTKSTAVESAL